MAGSCARALTGSVLPILLLAFLARAEALTVRVQSVGGVPQILVDDQPVTARMFYGGPGDHELAGSGRKLFAEQIQLAAKAHVRFVTFPVQVPWPRPGEPVDMAPVDALCDYILKANPQALLVPRVKVDAPPWWLDAHPEHEMAWRGPRPADAESARSRWATVASALYRQEAAAHLAEFIEHLESVYGDHVAGYHIAGQNTDEWFYEGTWGEALSGYAPVDQEAWRRWLRAVYPSDADLQRAWRDPAVSLDTAATPDAEARWHAATELRDPGTERMNVDWNRYRQEQMAETVCGFAHAARQASRGRKLVLFFYGYLFEFATVGSGPATSGHYDLRRVLDSSDIDVLCAPISYYDRQPGGSAPAMTAAESVALAGKLWLMEDDTSTYLNTLKPPGWDSGVHTLAATNESLMRNTAEVALRNMGTWWMDLCQTGWFDDPGMWAVLERLQPLLDESRLYALPFRPEIAAVLDEDNMCLLTPRNRSVGSVISQSRAAFGRVGAPYGQYLADDVAAGRTPWVKLHVFLDAWRLSASQRDQLLAQTRGKTKIWGYAPGYFDGETPSLEAMRQLTGFQVKIVTPKTPVITPTEAGRRLGLTGDTGTGVLRPTFAVADALPEEALATFDDGSVAVALRKSEAGTSLFTGSSRLTPELLRMAARQAGVHLYSQTDAVVYANGPFLAVHAVEDGPLTLDLEGPARTDDVPSGATVARTPHFSLPIEKGQTRVLHITPLPGSGSF